MVRDAVVVITGASSGVGRATARLFAQHGARIGLLARNQDGLKATAREIEALGGHAALFGVDVTDADAVESVAAAVESELGPIDIWINNAMVSVYSRVWDLRSAEVERVTAVNYLGTVYGSLAALHRMRTRNRGTIVQVGSGLAHRAIPLQAPYCASKHAIRAFTESLRVELMNDGSQVRVTMVQLPGLNTPHFTVVRSRMPRYVRPVKPVYSPELAAQAVLHAARHPRREYVVGGETAAMILAQKIVPGLLDRYLARTGVNAQQTPEPATPHDDNLFETVPGDRGAAGPFVQEAHDRSAYAWLSQNRMAVITGAAALSGVLSWRRRGR
ncbi:MAG: SDR family oxidoreductase [Actinomycetota bacterium]|nr:SDR family oxidoreductase [Actinomycetota bacterium]